jgi:hypothetical protein
MLLEDLGPISANGANPEHRRAVLTALGRLHGCSAKLCREGAMRDLGLPVFSAESPPTARWSELLERAPAGVGVELWMGRSAARIVDHLREQPAVLVHGDSDFSNFIITDSGAALVDWEKAQLGPAALDLGGLTEYIDSAAEWEAYRQAFGETADGVLPKTVLREWVDLGDARDCLHWVCYYLDAVGQNRRPGDDWRDQHYTPRLRRLESLRERRPKWFEE